MIPETKDLRLVFLELSSKRKLIGFIDAHVFSAIFDTQGGIQTEWIKLYHPVEAHAHMVTKDFFATADNRYPGTGILHAMNQDPQMRQQLDANALGDNSPLLRYYNDMKDRGPMWRLYYVYLAGCDYARPDEPMICVQHETIETIFPYREESDQQLRMLYDVEIRNIDAKLLAPPIPRSQGSPVMPEFRGLPVLPGSLMPGELPIPMQLNSSGQPDPRYQPPAVPQEVKP